VHQGTPAQRLVPGGTRRKDHRTVRCEHRTVRCGKPAAPTVTCSDRAMARRTGQATVRCPVHHWTVRCTTGLSGVPQRPPAFLQRLFWSWVLYILHPTNHLKVWEPKQHTKCRRFETGGSLSRRVSVLRAPAQMGRARGRA
jgi:nitrite reductase/ring-hydroxylating ferredoxin subunit